MQQTIDKWRTVFISSSIRRSPEGKRRKL